jgi:hypothetical protein
MCRCVPYGVKNDPADKRRALSSGISFSRFCVSRVVKNLEQVKKLWRSGFMISATPSPDSESWSEAGYPTFGSPIASSPVYALC